MDQPSLGGGPIIWLVEHRLVFCTLVVALSGVLGYFGLLHHVGTQAVGPGVPGLLYGVTLALVVLAIVQVWSLVRARRGR